jgi:hypothetical protein
MRLSDPSTFPGTYTYTVDGVRLGRHRRTLPLTDRRHRATALRAECLGGSPTNTTPHIAGSGRSTFAVARAGRSIATTLLSSLGDPAALSFDDVAVPGQGSHSTSCAR